MYCLKAPENLCKTLSPRHKPLFKARAEVVADPVFTKRLNSKMLEWQRVKEAGADIMLWWELLVKPGIKSLLIERGKEMNNERSGQLNLLMIQLAYLNRKVQLGALNRLPELLHVKALINEWHAQECEKVKIQSRIEEVETPELVRIYHHELHKKKIKRSTILKLQTKDGLLEGHSKVAAYLEGLVGDLLSSHPNLCEASQASLLGEVQPVFTEQDNNMFRKLPTKQEVKESVNSANMNAAPGNDGLTSFVYKHCWDILGQSLTEVVQEVHKGASPSLSQRTSLMVYGCKANKPSNSLDPSHKRRISLLNADFKIISGIENIRFKKVATHTLSKSQLAVGDDRRIHHGINKVRDAIFAASNRNQKCGVLDNDYMAAFDYMVLTWVFQVLLAKGLDKQVVNRLYNLYNNHLTVVVINGVQGRCFSNTRWSIRQGDRPSSMFFVYGLDPLLNWLEKRLRGIPIYTMDMFNAPTTSETFKVEAYVDDVKPAITSLAEFELVDKGSAIFEAASGCILHRDPSKGKVKFLPLGGWKPSGKHPGLQREDIPVPYIVLSNHLDMVGVKLCANYRETRSTNCNELQDKVKNVIGPWKSGKFMHLSQRSASINTYCLSKVFFKCSSIDLRTVDTTNITASIKSWLFQDQLVKPEDFLLYRARSEGGLGLIHPKVKAQALFIKCFLETATTGNFLQNKYHEAIFKWYVLQERDFIHPSLPPYISEEILHQIGQALNEGLLIETMTVKAWYKHLLEVNITHSGEPGSRELVPCRVERLNPSMDWKKSWMAASLPGLTSNKSSFLWKMLHDILPTRERMHRMSLPGVPSAICTLCLDNKEDNSEHALLTCSYIKVGADNLLLALQQEIPDMTLERIKFLDFRSDDLYPVTFLTATVLEQLWLSRTEKKRCTWPSIRAQVESEILLLRKGRQAQAGDRVQHMLDATSPTVVCT